MSNFAIVDDQDKVVNVIVIEQEVIDSGLFGDPATFEQTSYNTRGGVHYDPDTGLPSEDQSKAFRKNFAGIGYFLDRARDVFIPPKDYESWVLNEETCLWEPPTPRPNDGKLYDWDESTTSWKMVYNPDETPVVSVP